MRTGFIRQTLLAAISLSLATAFGYAQPSETNSTTIEVSQDSDDSEGTFGAAQHATSWLEGATRFALPVEFHDVTFDQYADLAQIAPVFSSRDASLLTDIALQIAEGERVLMRSHKSGVTARALLERAATLAGDQQDKVTLERLSRAADQLRDKELASQIAAAAKLGGGTRALDPALTISLETINSATALQIKAHLDAIKDAELLCDAALLDAVDQHLGSIEGATEVQKGALTARSKAAREVITANSKSKENAVSRLVGASRGWGVGDLNPLNKNSGVNKAMREFDRERLNIMDSNPRPGRDYVKVYLKNNSRQPIMAALHVYPYDFSRGNSSQLKEYNPSGPFQTMAWYQIQPGQRIHVAYTNNIYIYTYARSANGIVWGGDTKIRVGSEILGFTSSLIGGRPEEWTFNFN